MHRIYAVPSDPTPAADGKSINVGEHIAAVESLCDFSFVITLALTIRHATVKAVKSIGSMTTMKSVVSNGFT